MEFFDLIFIGGGAAGLAGAIAAKEVRPDCSVAVLEQNDRVGKKLAVTGNGQCNITNKDLSLGRYHGQQAAFAKVPLAAVGLPETEAFFARCGIPITFDETGRGYPLSRQASAVVDALRFRAEELGVELRTGVGVQRIRRGFSLDTTAGAFRCKKVCVVTGGLAGGKRYGTEGSGKKLLETLGHTGTRILPAIVQLKTDTTLVRQMKGVKVQGSAGVLVDGVCQRREAGEILFTEYGLSGPAILQLSRIAAQSLQGHAVEITVDLLPTRRVQEDLDYLTARAALFPDRALSEFFTGVLQKRLGQVLLRSVGLNINDPISRLGAKSLARLAARLHDFRFTVTDTTGLANAQTTAGGILTREFFPSTMESRLVPGLYAAGEVLDIDGDCGGFNLQWAWSSGIVAGIAAAGAV